MKIESIEQHLNITHRVSSEKEKSFVKISHFSRNFFFFATISLSFCISFAHEKCENFCFFREISRKFRFNLFREKMRKFREKNYAKKTQKCCKKYIAS